MIRRGGEILWILLASALAYALVLPRFFVGYFSDDARDILASRALLSGHYVNWQLPGHPPTNFPLPGFPLFLAPFTLFFFKHSALYRLVPFALTLLCVWLVNEWLAPWLSRPARLCAVLLFAFNPTTVVASGRVMADALFLVLTLAPFVFWQRANGVLSRSTLFAMSACAAFAAVTRPEGILLIVAITLALFISGRRRQSGPFFILSILPLTCVWVRNRCATGHVSGYASIWRDSLPLLAGHYAPFLKNAFLKLVLLCTGLVGGWEFNPWAIPFAAYFVAVFALVVVCTGFWLFARSPFASFAAATAFIMFAAFFFFLHAFWLAIDLHYLWPLLPITVLFGATAFAQASKRALRYLGFAGFAILFASYGIQYVYAVRETKHVPPTAQCPRQTLHWIADHTPAQSFLLVQNAPMTSLYTGRYATAFIEAHNEDEFRYRLLTNHITHVALGPTQFMYVETETERNPNSVWALIPSWIAAQPLSYEKLYADASEQTIIFAVQSDANFVSAYKTYLAARDAMDLNQWSKALSLLNASLADERLPGALNAFATVCLLQNSHIKEAKAALMEALQKRPPFALAALNLARIFAREGNRSEAHHYFAAARVLCVQDPAAQFLLPIIDQEEREMG